MRRHFAAVSFLVAVGSGTVSSAGELPYGSTLAFTVHRNGKEIGRHTVSFRSEGDKRLVTISVDLSVKTLGVTVYRYLHDSREVWHGTSLQTLEARTDDNGTKYLVRVQRDDKALVVHREVKPIPAAGVSDQGLASAEMSREILPADMLPTSNWNVGQVGRSVLLNTQYGKPSHAKITALGREPVRTASGGTIEATRYRYTGELRMDQWFDERGRWVKAAFPAFDGSMIEYILQE